MVKKLSCVSFGRLKRFRHTFTITSPTKCLDIPPALHGFYDVTGGREMLLENHALS